ncbi:hypothetical protein VTK56DRAFT_1404 [Thermocarpiscus australiensis]
MSFIRSGVRTSRAQCSLVDWLKNFICRSGQYSIYLPIGIKKQWNSRVKERLHAASRRALRRWSCCRSRSGAVVHSRFVYGTRGEVRRHLGQDHNLSIAPSTKHCAWSISHSPVQSRHLRCRNHSPLSAMRSKNATTHAF